MSRGLGFGLALLFCAGVASAQPSAADQKIGRDLFDRGVKSARAEDWPAAERYFTQAYAVYPRPTILGSLAGAQAKAGHITQAVASYKRLLQDPGDLSAAELSAFKAGAAAAEARLAWVRVEIVGPREGDTVLLDDSQLSSETLSGEVSADPGAHTFKLVRDSGTTMANVTLADGEHRKVTLTPALAVVPASYGPSAGGTPPPSPPIYARPWFWVLTGVVVAGATTAVLCVASFCNRTDDGYQGNLGRIDLR